MSNPPTPNVKIKMSSCDCNTRLTSIEGKVIVSFIGHTSFYEGVLDEANLLSYSSRMKQNFPLPPIVVFVIY